VPKKLERALKPRVLYRNTSRTKQIIDEMFDENIRLRRMILIKHFLYLLSVFIMYKYTFEGAVKKA